MSEGPSFHTGYRVNMYSSSIKDKNKQNKTKSRFFLF
uniref:Uncharacterized protein n=1 Tax=Nelumbo nucifera TaxID=4432 RepID=A0A822YRZ3_NELNU|nr:TPA_asm: hypothetical protein HUJ06_005533 [Nelumbo nucifera]